jgi:hypothetical protein
MYASVADLRAEGVAPEMATDERLARALDEASATIDRLTGWFFEPRQMEIHMNGRGTGSVEPPVPPIRIDALRVAGYEVSVDEYEIEGAPVRPWFVAPVLRFRSRRRHYGWEDHIVAIGLWGYTEPDGTAVGRTPLAIRRATMILALQLVPKLGEGDGGAELRQRWRIVEEVTRDQSYRLAPLDTKVVPLTGDADVDRLLFPYLKPGGLGAA